MEEEGIISKQFSTILKLSTIERLTNKAKKRCDAFNKWSYDITLNYLMDLEESLTNANTMEDKLKPLWDEIRSIKEKVN